MVNIHIPVLLREVIQFLDPQAGENFVDCTLGGGGYTQELIKRVQPGGKVLAIDLDKKAIENFRKEAPTPSDPSGHFPFRQGEKDSLILVHDNFNNLKNICHARVFPKINGIVLDLGLSSNQLEDQGRGFSFQSSGTLDMRFDLTPGSLTAFEIINNYNVEKLNEIFSKFGQEVLARPISKIIHETRQHTKIFTPKQLADLISQVYRRHYKKPSKIHPATKVFQALRIVVNQELENLKAVLPQAVELLQSGGRLAVISFHSLEDKIVKDFFRQESKDCLCPPEVFKCQCGHQAQLKILTKKPIVPSSQEIKNNPRARSAKLRVGEKL